MYENLPYTFAYLQYAIFYWPVEILYVAECIYVYVFNYILFWIFWTLPALKNKVRFLTGGFIPTACMLIFP